MLAKQIIKRYHKENVVLSSHLVAHTAFNIFIKQYPALDLFGILRLPKDDRIILKEVFYKNIELYRNHLIKLNKEGEIRLSNIVKNGSIEELTKHGIDNIGIFHVQKALFFNKEGNISSEDMNLLLYYHNRLEGYNLSTNIELKNTK